MRSQLVRLHRWAGLATAAFLILAGLTGSLLAFEDRLEAWINSDLFVAQNSLTTARDPFELREIAEHAAPAQAFVDTVLFTGAPSRTRRFVLTPRVDPKTGKPFELTADEIFLDPATGAVRGSRLWGESLLRRETAVSFLYRMHYALALPAPWSRWVLGTVGIVWTLNCVVGLVLTLPRRLPPNTIALRRPMPGAWRRWGAAWRFVPSGELGRTALSLHRALGLWLWCALLLFAWSSVMFNLRESVYRPVMAVFGASHDARTARSGVAMASDIRSAALDWRAAHQAGRRAMLALAHEQQFRVEAERDLRLDRARSVYIYRVYSSLDIPDAAGSTTVVVDARDGALLDFSTPTRGNAIEEWLGALHMARIFGLPYKLLIGLFGVVVAAFSLAGVVAWARRR